MADELEGRARALLAAYRSDAGPSPVATERLLASLRRSAASEGLEVAARQPREDTDGARVLPLRRRGYSRQWVGVAVAGLAAAAVLIAMRVAPRRLEADRGEAGSAAAHHAAEDGGPEAVRARRSGERGAAHASEARTGEPAEAGASGESAAAIVDPDPSVMPIDGGAPGPGAPGRGDSPDKPGGQAGAQSSESPGGQRAKSGESPGGQQWARSGESPGGQQRAKSGESPAGARSGGSPGSQGSPASGGAAAALAQEMGLVRAVHDALAGGQPKQALALLDEHGRRFPAGALHEEAAALRAVALCATDREGAGARAAAAFLAAHPGSLSAERVRRACGVR